VGFASTHPPYNLHKKKESNRSIAKRLLVTQGTVRDHLRRQAVASSDTPLGRRVFRMATQAQNVTATDKNQAAADGVIRNHVEGKFGQAQRRFSLKRIKMTCCLR